MTRHASRTFWRRLALTILIGVAAIAAIDTVAFVAISRAIDG